MGCLRTAANKELNFNEYGYYTNISKGCLVRGEGGRDKARTPFVFGRARYLRHAEVDTGRISRQGHDTHAGPRPTARRPRCNQAESLEIRCGESGRAQCER